MCLHFGAVPFSLALVSLIKNFFTPGPSDCKTHLSLSPLSSEDGNFLTPHREWHLPSTQPTFPGELRSASMSTGTLHMVLVEGSLPEIRGRALGLGHAGWLQSCLCVTSPCPSRGAVQV